MASRGCAGGTSLVRTEQLDFDLPAERIATTPAVPRDAAKLMVVHIADESVEHRLVSNLPEYLTREDLLVWNDTAVLAARLEGRRARQGDRGGGRVEGLCVEQRSDGRWLVRLSAGGRLVPGERIELIRDGDTAELELVEREGDSWLVKCSQADSLEAMLDRCGHTPLPPYIRKARRDRGEDITDEVDRDWYRTWYARDDRRGSIAAPTAGLHFTPELIQCIEAMSVPQASVTLHVGEGTFLPVRSETIESHPMHSERWHVDAESIAVIAQQSARSGRLVAVGTTTVRVLESLGPNLPVGSSSGSTNLLIAPGHCFTQVDAMMTNFHLPRSTLLALVGAFMGMDLMRRVYQMAIEQEYRFYSYGDAMLLLP